MTEHLAFASSVVSTETATPSTILRSFLRALAVGHVITPGSVSDLLSVSHLSKANAAHPQSLGPWRLALLNQYLSNEQLDTSFFIL